MSPRGGNEEVADNTALIEEEIEEEYEEEEITLRERSDGCANVHTYTHTYIYSLFIIIIFPSGKKAVITRLFIRLISLSLSLPFLLFLSLPLSLSLCVFNYFALFLSFFQFLFSLHL